MNTDRITLKWHTSFHSCDDCGGYENKECDIFVFDKKNKLIEEISRYSDGHMGGGDGYFEFLDMLLIVAHRINVSIVEKSFYNGNWYEELLTSENVTPVGIITISRIENKDIYADDILRGTFEVNGETIIDSEVSRDCEAEEDFIIACFNRIAEVNVEKTHRNYVNNFRN